MRFFNRKTTPKVVRGKVQRKNRWSRTPTYYNTPQQYPLIDRRKPGLGYRHILRQQDVRRFLALLPDWKEISVGLNAVVLAPGEENLDGWHVPRVVAVCAWDRDLWRETDLGWYRRHRPVLKQIGVSSEDTGDGFVMCHWTESTIRAYQLVHVLLHELGHHHDRMTTKSRVDACRGEPFAETYALRYAGRIWDRYLDEFGLP